MKTFRIKSWLAWRWSGARPTTDSDVWPAIQLLIRNVLTHAQRAFNALEDKEFQEFKAFSSLIHDDEFKECKVWKSFEFLESFILE